MTSTPPIHQPLPHATIPPFIFVSIHATMIQAVNIYKVSSRTFIYATKNNLKSKLQKVFVLHRIWNWNKTNSDL